MKLNLIFAIAVVLIGCKAKQNIVSSYPQEIKVKTINKDSLVALINNDHVNFETLVIRANAEFDSPKQSMYVAADIRMKKDQKIWINIKVLGIPMAKTLITPNRVAYYEKINNTFFDGDFSMLSDLVGTPLNFDKVQRLLLGKPINAIAENKFDYQSLNNQHIFASKNSNELFEKYTFDANPCLLKEQFVKQDDRNRGVLINYPSFTTVQNQFLPLLLNIFAKEKDEIKIGIEYKDFTFNEDTNFPFEIPRGYQEMKVK